MRVTHPKEGAHAHVSENKLLEWHIRQHVLLLRSAGAKRSSRRGTAAGDAKLTTAIKLGGSVQQLAVRTTASVTQRAAPRTSRDAPRAAWQSPRGRGRPSN